MSKTTHNVEQELTGDRAEQSIWDVFRIKKTCTVNDIWQQVEVQKKTIIAYLKRLENAGFAKREASAGDAPVFHIRQGHLKRAPRPDYPGRPKGRNAGLQNMWNTMRRLDSFTPKDIEIYSNTPDVEVSLIAAENYCRILLKAGYLRVVEKAKPPRKMARYSLIDDTGPTAPAVRREPQIYDPNENRVRYLEGGK